jgi:2-keto-4-pentenoate hydratase/2-oxohepta-3-ene-1,7-dioic acid hydratase in catechol pathway
MRFASFRTAGRTGWGAVKDGGLVELGRRLPDCPTLLDAVRTDALRKAERLVADTSPDLALDAIEFEPPLLGEKIICVGVNYANRDGEYKDVNAKITYPSLFVRFPGSFVGHGQPILRPRESEQFDYEGEIVLVIGREGRRVAREDALGMIAGLTLCNEGSVRDWLRHGAFNVTQGKNFDRSGSLGPWMVPAHDIDWSKPMHLTTRVNGETRQDDTTANLIHDFADLIRYVSTFTTLKPGDQIVSGTPVGAGARFDPPKWLKPGDVVEITVPEIGTLRNTVADDR